MLEQDYLVRLLMRFAEAIRRSMQKASGELDPRGAADMLEMAVGEATDIDGAALLSLAPESIASVMQVSGVDPGVTGYIAHALLLESTYLRSAGETFLADVRVAQAEAIANAYGFDLPDDPTDLSDFEDIEEED